MAETKQITFTHKEIAAILVKQQGIHEGLWGVVFEFAFGAGFVPSPPGSDNVVPGIVIPVNKIGIQRFDEPNPMTVDAAEVNPLPSS